MLSCVSTAVRRVAMQPRTTQTLFNTSSKATVAATAPRIGSSIQSHIRNFSSNQSSTSGSSMTKVESESDSAASMSSMNRLAESSVSSSESMSSSSISTASNNLRSPGALSAAQSLSRQVRGKGLFFEFSVFWVLSAYKDIAIGLMRNTVYTFRPIIMFFGFGYLVKFGFFLMGAPMLVSFYSVWLFEVGYGLAQCFLSVIFLTQLAYMDMSFRGRMRPMLKLAARRCSQAAEKLKKTIGC